MRVFAVIACAVMVLAVGIAPGRADKRVALVIGNDRYGNLPQHEQLRNSVNDARAVGRALGQIAFEVIPGENLGRQALVDKLDELTRRLSPGDTAFFFFSGHGVALDGANYILPADVPDVSAGQETRLKGAALAERDIVSALQGRGVKVAVVVLDACRTNPFGRPGAKGVGGEKGLMPPPPVQGVFSLYAASAGQSARDRLFDGESNQNSVFTRVLVPALTRPGLDLPALAVVVREEVARIARNAGYDQRPAYYDETIGGPIFLAGLPAGDAVRPAPANPAAQAWLGVQNSTSIAVLEEFRRQYPNSIYDRFAQVRIDELKKSQTAVAAPPVALPSGPPAASDPCGGGTITVALRCAAPLTAAQERALKPKDVFRECENCPEMVVAPAGSFTMGSPVDEGGRDSDEGPQHRVTFARQFAVGKFAVTFDEWDGCVAAGRCYGYKPSDQGWGRGRRPVINVSWDDARAYAAWLSERTGKAYRLLSEAEREYVTRAGTTTPFWWGGSISTKDANYNGTETYLGGPAGESRRRTVPVDSFRPNPWGLYQVHGNVWEWTQDCHNDSYAGAPADGTPWTSGNCSRRVLRGGSWLVNPGYLRAAIRYGYSTDFRLSINGFRLGRTLTP